MMKRIIYALTFVTLPIIMAPSVRAQTIYLPACGADPGANTRALQQSIDSAAPGSTLVLPSGVCVLAKCDIAQGKICYDGAGPPYTSKLHFDGFGVTQQFVNPSNIVSVCVTMEHSWIRDLQIELH